MGWRCGSPAWTRFELLQRKTLPLEPLQLLSDQWHTLNVGTYIQTGHPAWIHLELQLLAYAMSCGRQVGAVRPVSAPHIRANGSMRQLARAGLNETQTTSRAVSSACLRARRRTPPMMTFRTGDGNSGCQRHAAFGEPDIPDGVELFEPNVGARYFNSYPSTDSALAVP